MAGQTIIFRTFSLFNNGTKVILTNRINLTNFTSTYRGVKHETKDFEKYKIPEKPKKPLTAYFSYLIEKRPIIKKENPSFHNQDIIKKISDDWKALSSEAKKKYEDQATQHKLIYEEKFQDYTASLTPEQKNVISQIRKEKSEERKRRRLKKEVREEEKPKKPLSSYGIFVHERSKEVKYKSKPLGELMNELKDEWAEMPETKKDKYRFEYSKKKEEYEKELANWETKMIKEGKERLVREKTLKEHSKINLRKMPKPE